MKTGLDFGDLALIFKVKVELSRSNLSISSGGPLFCLKTILFCCIGYSCGDIVIFNRPLVNKKYIFLCLNQNICCGYTKEPSQ